MNAPGTAPVVRRVKSYEEELLDHIARQSRSVPVLVFGVLLLVASLTYTEFPLSTLVWLTAVMAVLGVRYVVLPGLPERNEWSLDARLNIAAGLSALNGLTHASCLVFFPELSDVDRAVQSLVLAGLCTASVATTAGNRSILLSYLVPIYPVLVLLWATDGAQSLPTASDIGVAISVAIMGLVLVMLGRDTDRQFRETLRIRKEQEDVNIQLEKALQDAGVADRAKTRFLASASHDLRQPIHALSLFGAALKMQELPEGARELADNIDESIQILASQLDALLDVSKLDAGVVTPEIAPLDLTSMLERIGREFEADASEKDLALEVMVDRYCRVSTDSLLLERVIRNLLNNAIRYTERGSVRIECRADGEHCCIAVADTGIGIPESEQDKIFSEFYQVSSRTDSARQGLGLGLSIVTRLLRLLEIPLELHSVPGEGTRMELTLRLIDQTLAPEEGSGLKRLQGVRVLVIDDDVSVRRAMSALLGGLGATPTMASNLREALDVIGQEELDVVISDLRLGTESGIEVIGKLREISTDLPAVLITGDTGAEQIREAHDSGLEVLHKPVPPGLLEKTLTDVVHARHG